jgi:hypothetical protein
MMLTESFQGFISHLREYKFNPLADIHAFNAFFTPFIVVSNGEKMPYLGPQHLFLFEKSYLKK